MTLTELLEADRALRSHSPKTLHEAYSELETQLAESRRTVLAEVANYIERQSKDPKWSPSSDGELEHFASHLADDVRNDWMAEVEASAEREA